MLGFPILYFKGMRLMMFQLSGFYCKGSFKAPFKGIYRDSIKGIGFRVYYLEVQG